MAVAVIVGTVIFIAIFIGVAYLITDKVMKEAEDEKTKGEYRKYFLILFLVWQSDCLSWQYFVCG